MPNKKTIEEVQNKFKEKGLTLLDNNYKNSKTKIPCVNNEGYKFYMKLYIEKNNLSVIIDFDSLPRFRNKSIRNFYLPCICTECSNKYYATWSQLTIYNRSRCERCYKRQSNLETAVKQYLDTKNIKYKQQKTFLGCKIKRNLPFDFYLLDYNCVIEVQGRQHYYEQKNYGRSLEEQKKYDKTKKDYCLMNDIIFIEIPYYSVKNGDYKNIIDNILE